MNIVVLGAGIVGSATGRGLAAHGHQVTFVDRDSAVVDRLRGEGLDSRPLRGVDYGSADVTMVCVSTPTVDCRAQLDDIVAAIKGIAASLRPNDPRHLVVIRSTVPPTTTQSVLAPLIESISGLRVGPDVGLVVNPEFHRQAVADEDFAHPWLTLLGAPHDADFSVLRDLYAPFGGDIVRTDWTTAEAIKYAHNLFNATKISFFNEFYQVCAHIGVDSRVLGETVARSAEGMWNPRYGTHGGWPYGGTCLAKDTTALFGWAADHGIDMPLLAATIEVNERMKARGGPVPADLTQVVPEHVIEPGPIPRARVVVPFREDSTPTAMGAQLSGRGARLRATQR